MILGDPFLWAGSVDSTRYFHWLHNHGSAQRSIPGAGIFSSPRAGLSFPLARERLSTPFSRPTPYYPIPPETRPQRATARGRKKAPDDAGASSVPIGWIRLLLQIVGPCLHHGDAKAKPIRVIV